MTIWSEVPLVRVSADGDVLERPDSAQDLDVAVGTATATNGGGPPLAGGRPNGEPSGPGGGGRRDVLLLLLGILLGLGITGVWAWAEMPEWSYFAPLIVGGGGLWILWKPTSLLIRRLVVAVMVVGTLSAVAILVVPMVTRLCSTAAGEGLKSSSKRAFEAVYTRGGGRERFGCPTGDGLLLEGGDFQRFTAGGAGPGVLAGKPGKRPVPIFGAFWRAYESIGSSGIRGAASMAGIPTGSNREDESRVIDLAGGECGKGGMYRQNLGRVFWVRGDIYRKYDHDGGHLALGFPISEPVLEGRRVEQSFEEGVVRSRVRAPRKCYSAG